MRLAAYFTGACWHLLAPSWRAEQRWYRAFTHARDLLALVAAVALWGAAVYLAGA